jgi:hypothetical protein
MCERHLMVVLEHNGILILVMDFSLQIIAINNFAHQFGQWHLQ